MKSLIKILSFLFLSSHLFPQQLFESQFIPFDGEANDLFGRDVAICDSFIFIGSHGDDNYSGSVYIYKKINNNWIFWKKLISSDRQEFDRFGIKLFLNGNNLFIGATESKVNNISSGAVYLFRYENGDWIEKQKIVPPLLQYDGRFSISIANYKNFLLVGAYNYEYIYEYAGRVFLFQDNNNNYIFKQELVPSDPQYIGRFGSAVAMDSSFILVGSVQDNTPSGDVSGSFYLFKKEDSLWIEKTKFLPDLNSAYLGYGCAIAMDSNYVFIGAYGEIGYVGPGSVYIYERSLDSLKLVQKIVSGEGYNYDSFGFPVVLYGDSAIIGAFSDTSNGEITGTAYLFVNENNNWIKIRKLTPSDKENANRYGISLSINNDNILIGAPETRVNGEPFIGKVYLYTDYPVFVKEELARNMIFSLSQNYPNPFNSKTVIEFRITSLGFVTLKLYDLLGNEVATLVNEELPAGKYEVKFNGNELPSGIYFYQIKAGDFIQTKKAVLIK